MERNAFGAICLHGRSLCAHPFPTPSESCLRPLVQALSTSLEPGVGLVVRVVAWDPKVLSLSPVGH